jgi:hypothetical protein
MITKSANAVTYTSILQNFKHSAVRTNTSFSTDLRGEHRAEPVPPEPNCLVADIDTTFE